MAEPTTPMPEIRFQRRPEDYFHWKFELVGDIARLRMSVQEE